METFHYPRPELAAAIVRQLTPDPIFGGLSGLHLAAPRRTGKTTFLRRDLVPEILDADKFPVIIDLWEDRGKDPSDIIRRRLGQTLDDLRGATEKAVDRTRLRRISALGFSVGLSDLKPFEGTITEGLERVASGVQRDVVLVVDEAQQAMVSETGMNAMFALKAARDAMNLRAEGPRLYLVMTGSHRGKLAELVVGAKSPFYGGSVQDFPVLGVDFVRTLIEQVNATRKASGRFSVDDGMTAFEILMHRPEAFMQTLRNEAFATDLSGASADLTTRAKTLRATLWTSLEAEIDGLTAIQRALLEALMDADEDFSPFASRSLEDIARRAGTKTVAKGTAQTAMKALIAKELVWQPGAGRYAIDNLDMLDMHRRKQGRAL
jgi:hypothetical protein